MAGIDLFQMERMQSLYWHLVEYDLSESGVTPMSIRELLGPAADAEEFVSTKLGYPLSEGAEETRSNVAAWYPGATAEHVTLVNGGSEANLLVLWTLLDPDDRLAFMVPNYLQGWGLGRHFGRATDVFKLRLREGRWALDVDGLVKAVTKKTKVIMVCNPNNPTGAVLSEDEMDVIVKVAERANAWIVADEIYRGAEVEGTEASPSFWGRTEKVVITSGMSKAFGMPGLRSGWVVAPPELIRKVWIRHDYTTLTPNMVSDILTAFSMRPEIRETIFARTRGIIRANLPPLERWIAAQGELLTYVRPVAGAIAYMKYALPLRSTRLVDKIREEQSVLLVSGDMFGLGKGFRVGFGFDVEQTLKGLERVAAVLAAVAANGA
ncbi:MAG: aminotransferase class I/II-fold pyridoxal phosphate-dependent enzyme [Solirubrobacterales bacterium]